MNYRAALLAARFWLKAFAAAGRRKPITALPRTPHNRNASRVAKSVRAPLVFAIGIMTCVCHSLGAATIRVGEHRLLPNTPGQRIVIWTEGGDAVSGIDFFAQVGDGGPELAAWNLPAGTRGPQIAGVDLKSGTIFQNVADLPQDIGSTLLPQTSLYTLALIGDIPSVVADGVLAQLEIDTTGLFGGSWPLRLTDVLPFDQLGGPYRTNFAGLAANAIQNGTLTIDPTLCDTNGDGRCDPLGDFDGDGQLTAADIDALSRAIRQGETSLLLDLNFDRSVDDRDRDHWVNTLRRTYFGDSNLDGRFGTADLVAVFQIGVYEDAIVGNADWTAGDWNGDGDFTTRDLVLAFQEGGYEQGPRAAIRAVPEPAASGLVVLSTLYVVLGLRNARRDLRSTGTGC